MAGEAGACQPRPNRYIPQPVEGQIDSPCTADARRSGCARRSGIPQKKKKGQPLSQDGWPFFFRYNGGRDFVSPEGGRV